MTYRDALSKRISLIIFFFLIVSVFVSCSDKVIGPQTADITPIKKEGSLGSGSLGSGLEI